MVMSSFQQTGPEYKIEKFFIIGRQRKIDCFSTNGFCSYCKVVVVAMGCFYRFCSCQEVRPCLTEEGIQCGQRKKDFD